VEKRRIEERKSQARIDVEEDMRKHEVDLGRQANKHVTNEMTKILDVALQDWSRQVRTTMAANGPPGNGYAGNGYAGNGPAGNGPAGNGPAGNGYAAPGPAPKGYAPGGYTPAHATVPGSAPNGYSPGGYSPSGYNGQASNGHAANGSAGGQAPAADDTTPLRMQRNGGFTLPGGDAL
jgi:hypothetical protein